MLSKVKRSLVGDRGFYKRVMAVSLPIMIQNAITTLISMLDNIMVGRVGNEAMTGVAIANQLILIFNLAIFGAVAGAGIFGAQFFGKNDQDGVRHTFRFKLISSAVITVIGIAVFVIFGEKLVMMYLLGEGDAANIEESLKYGVRYIRIMMVGFVPLALSQCYSSTLREGGETLLPMKSSVIAVFVNLVGNLLLIFGPGAFPTLGSDGAAIATVASRFFELAVVMIWTHRHSERFSFIRNVYRRIFSIPKTLLYDMVKKTLPLIANETLWALSVALVAQCFSIRSFDVVAAVNISSAVNNVFSIAFMALGSAISIILGQQLGANKTDEAVDCSYKLTAFSVFCGIVCGALLAVVAPLFPLIYNTTDSVRALATGFILILAVRMPIAALANATYFTIRSGGRVYLTMLCDTGYMFSVTYPITYALAYFTGLPILPLFFISHMTELGKGLLGIGIMKSKIWVRNIIDK